MTAIQRSEPLVKQVYRYLYSAILSGEFKPNDKVVETHIAEKLKVSRSPVREAIRLLIQRELLVEDADGVRVFQPTHRDFAELYEMRLALEPVCAERAAANPDTALLSELRENIQHTEEAVARRDWDAVVTLNKEFHECIWRMCGNRRILRAMHEITDLVQFYWRALLSIPNLDVGIVGDHREIMDAIERGDAAAAHVAMERHVAKDLRVIMSDRSNGADDAFSQTYSVLRQE
ncbi:GntR family transcriptional regulator [Alicyclobacillus vulcanalis]|uniref:Transcriptional regulator, GntR family n=1 Tax=Alicyclobacillus vulcanalis TaxID=252246 RepID=A0A1N7MF94_9BACL|nr:GntR family transcriptional regulator [Alicyclobacillus vulcanalis]SIS84728.1 transcriptional regulator, GntR family [Alicyclobacillus vulcanalis]